MYQGTTPALMFLVVGYDLSDKTVYLTFKSGRNILLTKTGKDLVVTYNKKEDLSRVLCILTQAETLAFNDQNDLTAQIRFIDAYGTAWATTKAKVQVHNVLYRDIIQYKEADI